MITLNLINSHEKEKLSDTLRTGLIVRIFLKCVAVCLVIVGMLVMGNEYLSIREESVASELQSTKVISPAGQALPVLDLTTTLNAQLAVLSTQAVDQQFDTVLTDVGTKIPSGITLNALTLTAKNGVLQGQGYAATRNDVPTLESNLKQLSYLSALSIQSSLNERSHIPVTFTATVNFKEVSTP